LYEVLHGFYEEQSINLVDVNIIDDEYMNNLCDIALEEYSNSTNYVMEFEGMELWNNIEISRNSTMLFGIAVNYITTTLKNRYGGDYHIPTKYFIDYNFNRIRVLFQYVYLSENRDVVIEILTNIYNSNDEVSN